MSTNSGGQDKKPGSDAGKVETEETLRPPDESVVTSDLPTEVDDDKQEKKAKPESQAEAGDDDKSKPGTKDQESAPGDDKSPDASKRRRSRGNRANRRLRKQLSDQQKRIDELEARIESGGDKPASDTQKPEPKLEDFNTPAEYAKAYNAWEAEQSESAPKKSGADTTQPGQPTEDQLKEINDFYQAGVKKYGDEYAEAVTEPDLRIDKAMAEFMFDTEYGHDIMMHLANNPDESQEIYGKSERRMLRAMVALEEKAKAGKLDIGIDRIDIENDKGGKGDDKDKDGEDKSKPTGSERFTPPTDTKDAGSGGNETSLEDAGMDDYAERRRAQMKKQGIR